MRRLTLIACLILVGNSVTAGNLCESQVKEVQAVCEDVNRLRSNEGAAAVRVDRQLTQVAQAYAQELSERGELTHGDFRDRMARAGIELPAAENIATGQDTPADVIRTWTNSRDHYRNMVDERYRRIGLGYHNGYWVQLFN